LSYSKTTGIATYGGNVAIVQAGTGDQGSSQLKADEVTFDDQKQNIEATGKVSSTFYIEQTPDEPGKKGPTRTELNSEKMTYIEATRTAVYTGAADMKTGEGANKQSLEAGVITLVMEAQRRALKSLEATASGSGIVLAKLPEGRQATGLKLTYDAATDRYVVTGKPARFVTRSTDPATCDVMTGDRADFPRAGGQATVTTEGATPSRADKKPCVEVLK
jgi:lipopolysaccharide export system protein LptA